MNDDDDLRRQLDSHEIRMERLVHRLLAPAVERLHSIETKLDGMGNRVGLIEARHIAADARLNERERLAERQAAANAVQTERLLNEREWSFGKKVGVATIVIGAISVITPVMNAFLYAIFS